MRALVVALGLLVVTTTIADAKPRRGKRVAVREHAEGKQPRRSRAVPQSIGRPAAGRLVNATRLRVSEVAHIRRPHRAYGTRTTVDFTRRAIEETVELHPRVHALAIGDLSAEYGGPISDHHSHQSGRDVDLGLFYRRKPNGYPRGFVAGTADNLDRAAMFTLLAKLTSTANKDGGVQVIFLDYDVQGIIYRWAKDHGVAETRLARMFQYPHARWSGNGIIRHYRNHANHIHVRFKCAKADRDCR